MKAYHEIRTYVENSFPFIILKTCNFNFLAHYHTDIEILYVMNGSLNVGVNQETRILRSGDIAIFASGDIHYYDSSNSNSMVMFMVFRPELIDAQGSWPANEHFITPFLSISKINVKEGETINNCFLEIYNQYQNKADYYEMFIKSEVFKLCGLLLSRMETSPGDNSSESRRYTRIEAMQRLIQFMNTNYAENLTLEKTASVFNISKYHFSRIFNRLTGMNFKLYLNNIRIQKAEDLLKNTDLPITRIAYECGFNNLRTFNRAFSKLRGMTPSRLRHVRID